jgi:hypothetical protein
MDSSPSALNDESLQYDDGESGQKLDEAMAAADKAMILKACARALKKKS